MSIEHLSEGEWKLMKLLWCSSPLTLRDFVDALEPSTGWNKSTIFMMLRRLTAKGAIRHDTEAKPQLYYPLISRSDATLGETDSFLERVWDGSIGTMISSLVGRKALTSEELAELRRLLDEAEVKK